MRNQLRRRPPRRFQQLSARSRMPKGKAARLRPTRPRRPLSSTRKRRLFPRRLKEFARPRKRTAMRKPRWYVCCRPCCLPKILIWKPLPFKPPCSRASLLSALRNRSVSQTCQARCQSSSLPLKTPRRLLHVRCRRLASLFRRIYLLWPMPQLRKRTSSKLQWLTLGPQMIVWAQRLRKLRANLLIR